MLRWQNNIVEFTALTRFIGSVGLIGLITIILCIICRFRWMV